jgi:hypothetical protein
VRTEPSRHTPRSIPHPESAGTPSWRRRARTPGEIAPAARRTEPAVAPRDVETAVPVAPAEHGDDEPVPTMDLPRLFAEPPSVASPAGSSAGSTTSAIADPHRSGTGGVAVPPPSDPSNPRVAGVSPSPVKRYRPGAPPASPHIGARALPASTGPVIAPIAPWYRRLAPWTVIVAVVAVVAVVVIVIASNSSDSGSASDQRPPAAAPQGTRIMSTARFGMAVPSTWDVKSTGGSTFGQLQQTRWGEPRIATKPEGDEAVLVAPLTKVAHDPLTDPDVFWSDQVIGVGEGRTISDSTTIGLHGLPATRVLINDQSGATVAVAVKTRQGVDLIAFRGPDDATAEGLYNSLVQTFDDR